MRLLSYFLLLGCLTLFSFDLSANTWIGLGDSNHWDDAGNWSGGVPGAGDDAYIGTGYTPYVDYDVTVNSLVMNASGLLGPGSITVIASFSPDSAQMFIPMTLLQGCSTLLTGTYYVGGGDITNYGDLTCSANLTLSACSFINYGTFNAISPYVIGIYYAAEFKNHGTLKKPFPAGTFTIIDVQVTNFADGDISVESGLLNITGNLIHYGDIDVSAGATMRTHQLDVHDDMTITGAGLFKIAENGLYAYNTNPVTINVATCELTESNGIQGSGELHLTQHFLWETGTISAPVFFDATCIVDVNPVGNGCGLVNTTTNNGTMNINGNMTFSDGTLVNNGTVSFNGAYSIGIYAASYGISNHGIVIKPVGSIGTFNLNLPLYNESDGQLLVQHDELNIGSNLYSTGVTNVSAGATLRIFETHTYDGSTMIGAGLLILQSNGLYAYNSNPISIDVAEVELSGQQVGATGTVNFTQHLVWTGGTLATTVNFAVGSVVDVNPGTGVGITGTTTNYGTMNINANMTFSVGGLTNYGLMSLNGAFSIGIYAASSGILNHGTIKKPASSGNSTYTMGVPLNNESDGSVIVESGELNNNGGTNNHGSIAVSAGAVFNSSQQLEIFDGSTISGNGKLIIGGNGLFPDNTANVTMDIAEVEMESNGSTGTGTITFNGHFTWKTGFLNSPFIIGTSGVFEVTSGSYRGFSSTLTNNGTININDLFSNNGTITNNGTMNINIPGTLGGSGLLVNTGSLLKNAAAGDVRLGFNVQNNGTIQCLSDNLFLAGLSNAGNIDVSAGANVQLDGYNFVNSFETGSSITGAGSFTLTTSLAVNADLTLDIQTFNLQGNFSGTNALTFNHTLNAQNALVENTIVIASSGILNANGMTLNGTLTNNGIVNCGTDLLLNSAAVIQNNANFHISGDILIGAPYNYFPSGEFNNAGTVDKTSAGTAYLNTDFNNLAGGSLDVQTGTLEVFNFDNSGNINIAADATLIVKDGNNFVDGTVTGNGTLHIKGNGWHLASTLTISSLSLEIDGNLTADPGATLEIQSLATWFSGNISVPTNVASGGTFNVAETYYNKTLSATLNNAGTFNLPTFFTANADINNSGNFNFTSNGGGFYGSSGSTFTNTGTVLQNVNSGGTIGIPAVNNGTVTIESASLSFSNGLENNTSVTIGAGSILSLSGNSAFNAGSSVTGAGSIEANDQLTLGADFTFSGETFTLNADLIGPGVLNINSAMVWSNGHIQTDVNIASGATLEIGSTGGGNSSKSAPGTSKGSTKSTDKWAYNSKKWVAPNAVVSPAANQFAGVALMNSFGPILSAIITNNGTTTQHVNYDMDGGTFNNLGQLNTTNGGINDGGNGGTLTNNGTWTLDNSFSVYVNAANNGTLNGNSYNLTFDPQWQNNGIVSPGLSPGQITFAHSYENGAELDIEVENNDGPGIGHDYVESQENIMLGGALVVTETGTPFDAEYVIMHCNGGAGCLTGTFSSTSLPSDYVVSYTGEEVILTKGQPAKVSPADTSICSGNPVTLTVSAGDSYQWSTGETTQSIDVAPYYNTTYSVTVFDSNGGGSLGSATVNVTPAPYEYVYPGYSYLCQGESATLTVYGDNGTYLWDNGETTQSITVSPITTVTYFVTITSDNGCTTVASATVEGTTNQPMIPEINGVPSSVCQGDPSFYLETYQSGVYGQWSGPGTYYGYYFDPIGLSGDQVLTFTPYPGQCAIAVNWTINVTNATWYADADGDGYGDPLVYENTCTQPSGYVSDNTDCDDTNADVHPNATEICNELDDDCDGLVDEGVQTTYYADADGDGYGNANVSQLACSAPTGFVADNTDCDDANAAVHPGATEVCNEIDDDCDGQVDEGVQSTFYADADGDGYGNEAAPQQACTQPAGYVLDHTDCNDNNAAVHPGAIETCNGLDDNCDGFIDEGVQSTFYADADGDGYGNSNSSVQACSAPAGYVSDNTDCDDTNSAINPGAQEICNSLDDNCNGVVDEGVLSTFYADTDGDGYGDANSSIQACSAPAGYVADNTDCNDSNGSINPGAMEICNNLDDDCDGLVDENLNVTWYADADGDGYGNPAIHQTGCTAPAGYVSDNTDCDDTRATVHPNAPEVCNGRDDDCDGQTDEGVQSTFYQDADGDGYGNPNVTMQSCGPDEGFVANSNDCDDTNPNIHPGAAEICDGLDNDCNGLVDNADPGITGQPTWYADTDGDGYGDASVTQLSCTQPAGFVSNNTDCDDTNALVNPGATEVCNQIDDDCDGLVDEGVQSTFYADSDGDGYGNALISIQACSAPPGYVNDSNDCNDSNDQIHPGATEICNGYDDDCDGLVDEGVGSVWYADADGDGYGNAANAQTACTQPAGYVANSDDCNDQNASIHPGAIEVCNNLDDDCDGQIDEGDICDGDGDGYTVAQGDCNDSNPNIHPGATEVCNGMDDDCDGLVDEGVGTTWYADADGDGYGNASVSQVACNQPAGYVNDANDCNDNNAQIHPGATEVCNNMDDDCDGLVDETDLNVSLSVGTILCHGGSATLAASGSGGLVPYQYSLDGGSFGASNSFSVTAGSHSVAIKDANNCIATNTIMVNEPAAISIDPIEITHVACGGGNTGAVNITVSGGTGIYHYHWSNNKTTQDLVNIAANTYTVTVTDANGCIATASATVNPKLKLVVTKTNTNCPNGNDGTATATVSGGTPGYTYNWSNGATTATITGLTPGVYGVTVSDALNCTRLTTVNIGQPAAMVITGVVTPAICNGSPTGAINVSVNNGTLPFTYNWSDGSTTKDRTDLLAGVNTLSVTDANGCTKSKSFTVGQPTALNLNLSVNDAACDGSMNLIATGSGGTAPYQYSLDGGAFASANSFPVSAGSHTIVVKDAHDCTESETTMLETPTPIVIAPILVTNVACGGGNTGAIDITVTGGLSPYTYHWSNNKTTRNIINLAANTYTVTVTGAGGCSTTASATVNPKLKLVVSKTNTTCNAGNDGTATATATDGTPGYTYIWNNGATTATISGLNAGTYGVTISDALGCTRSANISVGQPAAIGISGVLTSATCNGSATGAINITVSNGVAPFTYAWNDGATTEDRSNIVAGTYTVLVTDVNGCTKEKSFTVSQPTALTLSLAVTNVSCNGSADGEIKATANGGVKFPTSDLCHSERYCFNWSNGATNHINSALVAGVYALTITDANSCVLTGSASVTQPDLLVITSVAQELLSNGKYKLTVNATGGTAPYKYKRTPGGGFQTSNVFTNVPTGNYDITVRDNNLCETTVNINVGSSGRPGGSGNRKDSEEIQVIDLNNPVLVFPNPTTDLFHVQIDKEFKVAHLAIFNVQGQLMVEQDFEDNADLGTYEVNKWRSGLYFVVVHLDGERFTQKVMVVSK